MVIPSRVASAVALPLLSRRSLSERELLVILQQVHVSFGSKSVSVGESDGVNHITSSITDKMTRAGQESNTPSSTKIKRRNKQSMKKFCCAKRQKLTSNR